jgi:hypothetical protein
VSEASSAADSGVGRTCASSAVSRRDANHAVNAAPTLSAAATHVVAERPIDGSSAKPATNVPATAPSVLTA